MKHLPGFLVELRESRSLSQAQFAKLIGVSRQRLCSAEQGEYSFPRQVIKALLPHLEPGELKDLKAALAEDYINSLDERLAD